MGDNAPPNVDWGRLFAEAVLLAEGLELPDPEGLAQEGITMLFEGQAPPWDPSGETTLAEHVVMEARRERENRARVERRRRNPKMTAKLAQEFDRAPPTPEELTAEREDRARKFERVRKELAGDDDACDVVTCEENHVHEPGDQAEHLGWPIERVRNARKRVARCARALAAKGEEDEKDEDDP
jgi:hypothetical protein